MATKKATPKKTRGLSKKTNCSIAGSQLTDAKTKTTKAKAGAKLGSKYCKK